MDYEPDPELPHCSADLRKAPRSGEYATKPGSYEHIIQIDNQVLDPGENLKIEVFFTGYGFIESAKFMYMPSPKFIDPDKSRIRAGLKQSTNGFVGFLSDWVELSSIRTNQEGHVIGLTGLKMDSWADDSQPTLFLDRSNQGMTEILWTESRVPNAPIEFEFRIDNNARPGDYTIDFGFSYYNGEKWISTQTTKSFHVRGIFERHAGIVAVIGLVASFAAVVGLLAQVVKFIFQ